VFGLIQKPDRTIAVATKCNKRGEKKAVVVVVREYKEQQNAAKDANGGHTRPRDEDPAARIANCEQYEGDQDAKREHGSNARVRIRALTNWGCHAAKVKPAHRPLFTTPSHESSSPHREGGYEKQDSLDYKTCDKQGAQISVGEQEIKGWCL
jgi:hypothetical protein